MEGAEEPAEWKDSGDTDFEFSEMRMELFEDLTRRRKALEAQEREMAVREALLKAAEKELDQKYKELVSLRTEIQDLLEEQTEEEKQRVASLVKIYEGMKPKDAARIFNTLDMDILLNVVSRMSERKSAPIIASMDPSRARALTIMLMEQKSLPTLLGDVNS
jgi:flagellar motility protein MotE (MotC chaperone)